MYSIQRQGHIFGAVVDGAQKNRSVIYPPIKATVLHQKKQSCTKRKKQLYVVAGRQKTHPIAMARTLNYRNSIKQQTNYYSRTLRTPSQANTGRVGIHVALTRLEFQKYKDLKTAYYSKKMYIIFIIIFLDCNFIYISKK